MPERTGFVSTRFAGTDGVSLEAAKWAEVLWKDKHVSFWYGGKLDTDPGVSYCVPEAHFEHPEIAWINHNIWGGNYRSRKVSERIHDVANYLKGTLYRFVEEYELTLLVFQNVLSIPMHIPLGIASTEFLAETHLPAVAHHHDFYWERSRFQRSAINDYLEKCFPPRIPELQHAVINQTARDELAWRKGISSMLVPNVFDFANAPPPVDDYTRNLREDIGLKPGDIMVLQPTRIVPRKGIEHAIQLLHLLHDDRFKLVISHAAGDEGMEYFNMIDELARSRDVDIRYISDRIGEKRQIDIRGRQTYTLWDLYPHADLVTYPSLYEGFGNAFLEACYFRKPIVINRYPVFERDIEPLDFDMLAFDGFPTSRLVPRIRRVLEDEGYRQEMVEHNYQVAAKYFSYEVLHRKLRSLISIKQVL